MCGFAGAFLAAGTSRTNLTSVVEAMAATLDHRGPDDSGTWTDEEAGIGLGFRRLAIIDVSQEGHQPMHSRSGRYTLVYNGEVYNHGLLRAELERLGVRFRGSSDTEVILAAFEVWGVSAALRRLEGMFAMALWDSEGRSATLIRDRLGIKPLYYQAGPGFIAFGSELKALAAFPRFDGSLDLEAVTAFLRYLYIPAPLTIYRKARKLPPGHVLRVESPEAPLPKSEAYWSLRSIVEQRESRPFIGTEKEATDALESLLLDSIGAHMRSDVPLGAFLSAGIDSSTVVSIMQELSPRPIRSFSVAFDVEKHNETRESARIAEHIGTDHTELLVTGKEALAVVPSLPDLYDEPQADISQIPVYLLCAKARRDVTVALSGDGGDEVFGGYNRYTYGPPLFERLMHVPQPMRRVMGAGIQALSPPLLDRIYRGVEPLLPPSRRQRLVGEKTHKLGGIMRCASPSEMYRSLVSVWPDPAALVIGGRDVPGEFERTLESESPTALLDRIMLADEISYLPDDQFTKVDRASMAVGLEVRVPLVDHRLVEFAWRLPQSLKVREKEGKWLLRQVLYRRVPRALMERPKFGFSVPVAQWLVGPLRSWAEALLDEARLKNEGLLNARLIRRAWSGLLRGREENALGLWAVLMLQAWRERWVS